MGLKGGEHLLRPLDDDDPGLFCGELMVIPRQKVVEQIGQRSRRFNTGGTGANNDESERAILNQARVAVGGFESV